MVVRSFSSGVLERATEVGVFPMGRTGRLERFFGWGANCDTRFSTFLMCL